MALGRCIRIQHVSSGGTELLDVRACTIVTWTSTATAIQRKYTIPVSVACATTKCDGK